MQNTKQQVVSPHQDTLNLINLIVVHGLSQIKKGKNPTMGFPKGHELEHVRNPKIVFSLAKKLLKDTKETLLSHPIVGKIIDWEEEYEKHLAGPNAHIPFGPKDGVSIRECKFCFYRTGPKNPKKDCQIVGRPAHKYFGLPVATVMPTKIAGKEVGHFCPNYLDYDAE